MCHSAPQDPSSRCWIIDVIDEDDDDCNHENEEPSFQTGEKPNRFERAKFFMHLVVTLSLKNLRHSADSNLSLALIRIKESGTVFTLGDPDGPRCPLHLSISSWEGLQKPEHVVSGGQDHLAGCLTPSWSPACLKGSDQWLGATDKSQGERWGGQPDTLVTNADAITGQTEGERKTASVVGGATLSFFGGCQEQFLLNLHVFMEIMRPALVFVKTAGISYFREQALSQTVSFPEIICLACLEAVYATGKITTSGDNHPSKWRISGSDPKSSAACVGPGWSRTCGQDNMSRWTHVGMGSQGRN